MIVPVSISQFAKLSPSIEQSMNRYNNNYYYTENVSCLQSWRFELIFLAFYNHDGYFQIPVKKSIIPTFILPTVISEWNCLPREATQYSTIVTFKRFILMIMIMSSAPQWCNCNTQGCSRSMHPSLGVSNINIDHYKHH